MTNKLDRVPDFESVFSASEGQPLFFASVRRGKAYISFHLMPLYMCAPLTALISPALKKRMQGKTCFNFKSGPEPEILKELASLTNAAVKNWDERKWL